MPENGDDDNDWVQYARWKFICQNTNLHTKDYRYPTSTIITSTTQLIDTMRVISHGG